MSSRIGSLPAYRLHKGTGQAVVTLNGKDFYLGRHGTPNSVATYDRTIEVLGKALNTASVDRSEKVKAFRRLSRLNLTRDNPG